MAGAFWQGTGYNVGSVGTGARPSQSKGAPMSDELLAAVPRVIELNNQEQILIQADQVQQAHVQLATPSAEQIHSADGVFTQQHKIDDDLSAILGVTTGILILHDMAVDRFTTHEEDDEQPPKPKENPEEE
jgi:hypothetical protein